MSTQSLSVAPTTWLHRTILGIGLATAILQACLVTMGSPARAAELTVAAAADLKFALDDLATEFRTNHPGITVKISYGSSGNFFAQLQHRASSPRPDTPANSPVLSDIIGTPHYVLGVLGGRMTGVNVFYGEGSATSVVKSRFHLYLMTIPDAASNVGNNTAIASIWAALDQGY